MARHTHEPHHQDRSPDWDWAVVAADITREGEVLMLYLKVSSRSAGSR